MEREGRRQPREVWAGTEGTDGVFLETSYRMQNGWLRWWLKNDNSAGQRRVWRYQDYRAHAPDSQKWALMVSALRRVDRMASDDLAIVESARDKLQEFAHLGYPAKMQRRACQTLATSTGRAVWRRVRLPDA